MRDLQQGDLVVSGGHCSSVATASGGSVVPEMERGTATLARATATLTGDGRGSVETAAPAGRGFHPAAQRAGRCGCEATARSGC